MVKCVFSQFNLMIHLPCIHCKQNRLLQHNFLLRSWGHCEIRRNLNPKTCCWGFLDKPCSRREYKVGSSGSQICDVLGGYDDRYAEIRRCFWCIYYVQTAQSYYSAAKMDKRKNENQRIKQIKKVMNEWVGSGQQKLRLLPTLPLSSVSQVSAHLYAHTLPHVHTPTPTWTTASTTHTLSQAHTAPHLHPVCLLHMYFLLPTVSKSK